MKRVDVIAIQGTFEGSFVTAPYTIRTAHYINGVVMSLEPPPSPSEGSFETLEKTFAGLGDTSGRVRLMIATPDYPIILEVWPEGEPPPGGSIFVGLLPGVQS